VLSPKTMKRAEPAAALAYNHGKCRKKSRNEKLIASNREMIYAKPMTICCSLCDVEGHRAVSGGKVPSDNSVQDAVDWMEFGTMY
jgi:hypothetical protein